VIERLSGHRGELYRAQMAENRGQMVKKREKPANVFFLLNFFLTDQAYETPILAHQ
jgi:hypothetical protein